MRKSQKILFLFVALFSSTLSVAQDLFYKDYDWEKDPKPTAIDAADSAYFEIFLFEKKASEINFGPDGNAYEYYLYHKKVKVNSDEAIERNNKVYLPNNLEMITFKVRTISAEGKVRELNRDDIIESEENDGKKYKYFALEGLEKGSEIEEILYLKLNPRMDGFIQFAQSDVYKKHFEFELISPEHLLFKFKGYNGFPEMQTDSTVNDRNLYRAVMDNLPPVKNEKYALTSPFKSSVLYKLKENTATGNKNFYTYSKISELFYNKVYADYSKNKKVIAKWLKKSGLKTNASEAEKIIYLENKLKDGKFIFNFSIGLNMSFSDALNSIFCSSDQMLTIMAQICQYLNIEHQVVLTCNRYDYPFDKDFEAYNFLEDYLLYFPNSNLYISPGSMFSRSKYIESGLYNNYGLFLQPVKVADYTTAVGKINFIEAFDDTANTDSLFLNCALDAELSKFNINFRRSVRGYGAQDYQFLDIDSLEKESREEIYDSFSDFLTENKEEVKSMKVENARREDFPQKPLITAAELSCDKFIEEAGENVLIKMGELIGPQAELYQKDKREHPVDNHFNHLYYREIVFTVPDGYKITNADDIKMLVEYKNEKGKAVLKFESTYKLDGNKLTVYCTEYYNQVSFPVEQFEEFRKVINAAADFNKVTLILSKK